MLTGNASFSRRRRHSSQSLALLVEVVDKQVDVAIFHWPQSEEGRFCVPNELQDRRASSLGRA